MATPPKPGGPKQRHALDKADEELDVITSQIEELSQKYRHEEGPLRLLLRAALSITKARKRIQEARNISEE